MYTCKREVAGILLYHLSQVGVCAFRLSLASWGQTDGKGTLHCLSIWLSPFVPDFSQATHLVEVTRVSPEQDYFQAVSTKAWISVLLSYLFPAHHYFYPRFFFQRPSSSMIDPALIPVLSPVAFDSTLCDFPPEFCCVSGEDNQASVYTLNGQARSRIV